MQMHPPWLPVGIAGSSGREEEADVQMLWPGKEIQERKYALLSPRMQPQPHTSPLGRGDRAEVAPVAHESQRYGSGAGAGSSPSGLLRGQERFFAVPSCAGDVAQTPLKA